MAEFDQIFANDPNNPQSVAENGVVSIYAPGTRTLLSLRTVTGEPLSNPLRVNSRGFGPAFMVDGFTEVAWEAVAPGEVFSGTFKSYKGVLEEALAAKAASQSAASTASDAAAAAVRAEHAASGIPRSTQLTYDAKGNVETVTEGGVTTSYTYNPDGSVATDTRLGVTRAYTYINGNLTRIEVA